MCRYQDGGGSASVCEHERDSPGMQYVHWIAVRPHVADVRVPVCVSGSLDRTQPLLAARWTGVIAERRRGHLCAVRNVTVVIALDTR